MRRIPRRAATPVRIVKWVAVFRETVLHAYFGNQRFCAATIIASVEHWQRIKKQPLRQCKACCLRLARGLQPTIWSTPVSSPAPKEKP